MFATAVVVDVAAVVVDVVAIGVVDDVVVFGCCAVESVNIASVVVVCVEVVIGICVVVCVAVVVVDGRVAVALFDNTTGTDDAGSSR